jgi:hypothetical protein
MLNVADNPERFASRYQFFVERTARQCARDDGISPTMAA